MSNMMHPWNYINVHILYRKESVAKVAMHIANMLRGSELGDRGHFRRSIL